MALFDIFKSSDPKLNTETKYSATRTMMAYHQPGAPIWSSRDYMSLTKNGFLKNVIAYRCIRMIAEAAASAPLRVSVDGEKLTAHPVISLLEKPNADHSGTQLLEALYGYLQTHGNAYLEGVMLGGEVRELYALRPDRISVRVGKTGWIEAYEYTVSGVKTVFPMSIADMGESENAPPILHIKLFHPLNDHYGMSPLEVAAGNIDMHNTALSWNKALLDNAARPSGALVYSGPEGAENLSSEQFERLKSELEDAYGGATNAGKPLLLDGGLDWRSMSLSPADMDFMQAKNAAAREIALAFGVPPMLLGIPGDNTYSNYREANLAFWKQTVLPLVKKTTAALTQWLRPGFSSDGIISIQCHVSDIDALSGERDALWRRVNAAQFLSDSEKRDLVGLPPKDQEERNADDQEASND